MQENNAVKLNSVVCNSLKLRTEKYLLNVKLKNISCKHSYSNNTALTEKIFNYGICKLKNTLIHNYTPFFLNYN